MLEFIRDVDPFAGVTGAGLVLVAAAYVLGFFIRGAFGFGSNMPIVLLTTWVLGPHHAIVLVSFCAFVAQIHLLPQGVGQADWSVAAPLLAGVLAGSAVGVWLLTVLEPGSLTLTMGALVMAVVAMDRYHLLERLQRRLDLRSPPVTGAFALTSGGLGTVAGGGGQYFLVAYLKLACEDPRSLRGTSLMLTGLTMVGRLVLMSAAGLFTLPVMVESALLVPGIFLGTLAGTRVFRATSPRRFYLALQWLLLAAAAALVAKGLRDTL